MRIAPFPTIRGAAAAAVLTLFPIATSPMHGQIETEAAEVTIGADNTEAFDDVLARVTAHTEEQHRLAAEQLNRARERIAAEKTPLLARMRAAEDRILAASAETRRLQTQQENAGNERRRLARELDAHRKSTGFATTVARDSLAALADSLPPGEPRASAEDLRAMLSRLENTETPPTPDVALDTLERMLARVEKDLGGSSTPGEAIHAGTNQIVSGQFAFAGPEVFFRATDGQVAGPVRMREDSEHAVVYPRPEWSGDAATRYFAGEMATIPADASGGKALRLEQTQGTLWSHIEKGGIMAFVIIGVGVLAVLMIIQKIRDLATMRTEDPARVETFLALVARGDISEAERAAAAFKGTTHELFAAGLKHRLEPKPLLEEHLESVLLEQRLHFERRLPLLAVIATAAPLMGLLGTVVGMVKTFALITVFGTGNAGKLSSGISEVLVATELGLAVAIPSLIAHGFLAHRIEKNLSQLERYALRFAIAVETARSRPVHSSVEKATVLSS